MGPLNAGWPSDGAAVVRATPRRRNFGFTLVEMLVVLLVLALAAGMTYARYDSDPRRAVDREGRRLAAAIEHAAVLAQFRNHTLGVSAGGAGYRFWHREYGIDGDRWVPLTDDDVLAAHALPDGLTATAVQYAGQDVPADAILPLAASGRNEPYTMEISTQAWHALIVADPLNRVALSAVSPR